MFVWGYTHTEFRFDVLFGQRITVLIWICVSLNLSRVSNVANVFQMPSTINRKRARVPVIYVFSIIKTYNLTRYWSIRLGNTALRKAKWLPAECIDSADMMTSSNGNIFRVTGRLCGQFTGLHKGQWSGALMFSSICVWINGWVNSRGAGDLRHHHAHYVVIVMYLVNMVRTSNQTLTKFIFTGQHCNICKILGRNNVFWCVVPAITRCDPRGSYAQGIILDTLMIT